MENIDELMRQKFNSEGPGERFEFQEEFWEQAQILLEQEEKRRRRRLWLFLIFALGTALLAWLLLGPSGLLAHKKTEVGDSNRSLGKTEVKQHSEGGLLTDSIDTRNIGQAADKAEQELAVGASSSERSDVGPKGKVSDSGISRMESQRISTDNFPQKRTNDQLAEKLVSKQGAGIKKPTTNAISASNPAQKTTQKAEKSTSPSPTKTEAIPQNQVPVQDANGEQISGNKMNENTPGVTSPVPVIPAAMEETAPYIPIFIIPTPISLFELPGSGWVPRKMKVPETATIAQKKDPSKDKPFTFGLSLAGAAYQQPDTSGLWAGFAVGAYGEYRLNKSWSVLLGGQWRFVPGLDAFTMEDSTNPNVVEQIRYSFGYKSELWKRETRGLHMLEIPFAAKFNQGKWGVEAGGAVGMLFAVQNKTTYTVSSSLEPAKTTVKKYVKGIKTPYNSVHFGAFAGASYQLNNRFSLLTRLNYRFTPVFKTAQEGVKNNGLGNVELGLRVRLF